MKRFIIRFLASLRRFHYTMKCFLAYLFTKTKKNYIYFDSFGGKSYNDNPLEIFNYIKNNYPNHILVWAFKDKNMMINFKSEFSSEHVIVVKFFTFKHFYYLKKCFLWVVNYKMPVYFKKTSKTIYLQTWHGIPLKKLGCDIENHNQTFYRSMQTYQQMVDSYIFEGSRCDYFITPSTYAYNKLKSAFNLNDSNILKVGYPRNIKLYTKKNDSNYINNLKKELNLTKKTILYAPTWRDDNSNLFGYQTKSLLDFDILYDNLAKEYQILYRPHYLIKESKDLTKYQDFIIDVTNFPDLSDLMLVSDLLITDYSSLYFDYSLLNKPIYFIMLDLNHYKDKLRGFYINIDTDLPNDYYINELDLVNAIKHKSFNQEKYDRFLQFNSHYKLTFDYIDNIIKTNL